MYIIEDSKPKAIEVTAVMDKVEAHSLNIHKTMIDNVANYIVENFSRIKFCAVPQRQSKAQSNLEKQTEEESKTRNVSITDKIANGLKSRAMKLFMKDLEKAVDVVEKSFSDTVFEHIAAKNLTDIEVYKRALVDRRLFSKIRSNRDYSPSRNTAIRLAIALELTMQETENLLNQAGYSIGNGSKRDLIIKYFIENQNYDIILLNNVLFAFEEDTLN